MLYISIGRECGIGLDLLERSSSSEQTLGSYENDEGEEIYNEGRAGIREEEGRTKSLGCAGCLQGRLQTIRRILHEALTKQQTPSFFMNWTKPRQFKLKLLESYFLINFRILSPTTLAKQPAIPKWIQHHRNPNNQMKCFKSTPMSLRNDRHPWRDASTHYINNVEKRVLASVIIPPNCNDVPSTYPMSAKRDPSILGFFPNAYKVPLLSHPIQPSPIGKSRLEGLPTELHQSIMGYLVAHRFSRGSREGDVYAAILSQTSKTLLEIHGTRYLANVPKEGERGRVVYMYLLFKDSISFYWCFECEDHHAYADLFASPCFQNGLITPFDSEFPKLDKRTAVSRCPNTIYWEPVCHASSVGIVVDAEGDAAFHWNWKPREERFVREMLTHTMPFIFVDYMRACARLGHEEKFGQLFPKEMELWYSAKWNSFWPEAVESATTRIKLQSEARWEWKGLITATTFRFSKAGDATFEEGILRASQKLIVCPHISFTKTRRPVWHQRSNASTKDFGYAIDEACAYLSFTLSPATANLKNKYHLQEFRQIQHCDYCPTEFQVSTSLQNKEVIIRIYREFGYTTQNALDSQLPRT